MFELVEKIREHASENSLAPAICTLGGYISYSELEEKIAVIANYLDDRRIPRLSKAYLNIANTELRLITTIACLHCGLVPIIITRPPERGEIDCDLVVAAPQQLTEDLRPDLVIDETVLEGKLADRRLREFESRADDELFYIGATTGTTGRRRFVAYSYGQYRARRNRRGWDTFGPGVRVMFTMGDTTGIATTAAFSIFDQGATLVRAQSDPLTCVKLINIYAVERLMTVPKMLEDLMELMEKHALRCPSVNQIDMTGSLFTKQLIERADALFDAELWVAYGTSETSGISRGRVTAKDFVPGYVGEIHPGYKFVVDSRTAGQPGELILANDEAFMHPYYENGEIIRNETPFYRLPDVGYIKDGSLYLMGRDDEVYNFSGIKIAFSTIEEELRRRAEVADVAIVGDPSRGNPLDLLIAVVAPDRIDADSLVRDLCAGLGIVTAEPHIRILQTESIARNEMGKIDRQAVLKLVKPGGSTVPEPAGYNGGGA